MTGYSLHHTIGRRSKPICRYCFVKTWSWVYKLTDIQVIWKMIWQVEWQKCGLMMKLRWKQIPL